MNNLMLATVLILAASPTLADPDDDASESQWVRPDQLPPAPAPTPGRPGAGYPEGGYADPDRRRMDEERRKDVLDQLCRKLKLRKDFTVGGGDWPAHTLGFSRRMESDIDGGLAMIDEESLTASWSRPFTAELGEGGPAGAVWGGATISGKSMVIRRLGSFNTCSEVDRLIKVQDVKLAIPFTSKRIMAMDRGELWRIPLTLNVGYGVSASDAMDGAVSLSLGMAKSKNGAASMTLWRMSEKQARFRFRVDFVQVHSRSFSVSKTIPAAEFAFGGTNALLKFVDKEIAKQLNRYTALHLGIGRTKSDGRRLVLEYVIDPTDPVQAKAMAEALQGNFRDLLTLARRMATTKTSPEETREAYEDLQEENALQLGYATYAAMSQYHGRTRTASFNVPFLFNGSWSSARGDDAVVRYTGEGGEFKFHNASRSPNAEYFNMPFLGPLVKDLETRNVEFVTYAPNGGGHQEPFGVYMHNQAFLRLPASTVSSGVEDANQILRLAGAARRGAGDRTMEIPVPAGSRPEPGAPEQSDQKGWVSLTMVINQKAVREALAASSDEILKAFAFGSKAEDRAMAEWLVKNGRLEGDRLAYDQAQAARELDFKDGDGSASWLARMSVRAGGLVRDMAEAASQPTSEERAAKLAKVFSYENRSGMSHADVFRVLIQFVDPMDVSGDFVAAVDGTHKTAASIKAHFVLKKGRAEVENLGDAGAARGRFADGSILTD